MKKLVSLISVVAFLGALGILSMACSNGDGKPATPGAPEWVDKGSGAFTGDRGKAIYGVGSAPKMADRSMQRDRADGRARRKILEVFNTYIAYMAKDYARSTAAGTPEQESYESDFLQVQKNIAIGDISGAQIVNHWRDDSDGTMYALAVLDLAAVSELLSTRKELNAKMKDYVRANAAKAFDDLEKEEVKRGQ